MRRLSPSSCWLLLQTASHLLRNSQAEISSYTAKEDAFKGSEQDFDSVKKLEFSSPNRTVHARKYSDLSHWAHPHFDYGAKHGPRVWYRMYPPCRGAAQSPVDLDTSTAQSAHSPRMLWWGYALRPAAMTLANNGHTVVLTARWNSSEDVPYVWESPGDEQYSFAQLHFHWGADDDSGSEHTVNKERFPLEAHLVHYLHSLGSLENALHYEAGVRVVGMLYRLSEQSNPALEPLVSALGAVARAGSSAALQPFPLGGVLRSFSRHYLAYSGSLTTPPCLEVVRWALSTEPQGVSRRQMSAFRSLLDHKGLPIRENFRPLQPLNNRQTLHIR
ncbi:carbonic anhydrase 2-like [Bacillus rossius redtenbacheri]|uniref:carbonic anhydrase 2-like n=1 Tax=Bacillus rossius redtenbacheri TaxID=93214 RepID=UPI002FDCB2FE